MSIHKDNTRQLVDKLALTLCESDMAVDCLKSWLSDYDSIAEHTRNIIDAIEGKPHD